MPRIGLFWVQKIEESRERDCVRRTIIIIFWDFFLLRLNNGDRWERERDGGWEELQAGADLQGHQRGQDPGLHHLAEGKQGQQNLHCVVISSLSFWGWCCCLYSERLTFLSHCQSRPRLSYPGAKLVILSWPQITPLYFSRGLKLLENKILSSSNFKLRRSVAEPPDLVRSNFNGQEASLERGGYFSYSE